MRGTGADRMWIQAEAILNGWTVKRHDLLRIDYLYRDGKMVAIGYDDDGQVATARMGGREGRSLASVKRSDQGKDKIVRRWLNDR